MPLMDVKPIRDLVGRLFSRQKADNPKALDTASSSLDQKIAGKEQTAQQKDDAAILNANLYHATPELHPDGMGGNRPMTLEEIEAKANKGRGIPGSSDQHSAVDDAADRTPHVKTEAELLAEETADYDSLKGDTDKQGYIDMIERLTAKINAEVDREAAKNSSFDDLMAKAAAHHSDDTLDKSDEHDDDHGL